LADSTAKPGSGDFGRFEAKRGVGQFADKAGSDDFGRFGGTRESGKRGKRRFWPIPWQSWETVVLGDLELERGIDRFAGKSEIAEGRSDLRESVIRNDLLVGGRHRTDRSAHAA